MAVYAYKGINTRGKDVQGVRDADSAKMLRTALKRDGVLATEILEQAEAAAKKPETLPLDGCCDVECLYSTSL